VGDNVGVDVDVAVSGGFVDVDRFVLCGEGRVLVRLLVLVSVLVLMWRLVRIRLLMLVVMLLVWWLLRLMLLVL